MIIREQLHIALGATESYMQGRYTVNKNTHNYLCSGKILLECFQRHLGTRICVRHLGHLGLIGQGGHWRIRHPPCLV